MGDELKVDDIYLKEEDSSDEDFPLNGNNKMSEQSLPDRWRRWVDAVNG